MSAPLASLRAAGVALAGTTWRDRARVLGRVGARFLDEGDPLRTEALEVLPGAAGLSRPQARRILDGMARDWTGERLAALVRSEFGDPDVLDGWVDDRSAPEPRRIRAFPLAPGVAVHVCAGTVPGVSVTAALRALLVGAPVLLKPGAGDRILPDLFHRGLEALGEHEPTARVLGQALEVIYWPGGDGGELEASALQGAGWVVVYGGDDTVRAIRSRTRPGVPLVGYGHRVSVGVVGPAMEAGAAAAEFALAVAVFDQRGCVSPHHVFVVGAEDRGSGFAEALARALAELETVLPGGPPDPSEAAAVHQSRGAAEMRRAAGEAVRVWAGAGVGWTVVLDPDAAFRPSCGGRMVHVTPIPDPGALDAVLAPVSAFLQSVGIVGFDAPEVEAVAERLGRLGASRVVPPGSLPFPPAWWLHDGEGALRRLVRWVDLSLRPAAAPRAR